MRKKKTTHYKEQSSEKVAEYQNKIKDIPENKMVYVDEAGLDNYLYREYSHSPKGQRVYERIKGKNTKEEALLQ